MPRLSDDDRRNRCNLVEKGDTVAEDILAEIETDKATMEFESSMQVFYYM
jgi:hypothetical protein